LKEENEMPPLWATKDWTGIYITCYYQDSCIRWAWYIYEQGRRCRRRRSGGYLGCVCVGWWLKLEWINGCVGDFCRDCLFGH